MGPKSDVWGWGVTIYETVMGTIPFDRVDDSSTEPMVVTTPVTVTRPEGTTEPMVATTPTSAAVGTPTTVEAVAELPAEY